MMQDLWAAAVADQTGLLGATLFCLPFLLAVLAYGTVQMVREIREIRAWERAAAERRKSREG